MVSASSGLSVAHVSGSSIWICGGAEDLKFLGIRVLQDGAMKRGSLVIGPPTPSITSRRLAS